MPPSMADGPMLRREAQAKAFVLGYRFSRRDRHRGTAAQGEGATRRAGAGVAALYCTLPTNVEARRSTPAGSAARPRPPLSPDKPIEQTYPIQPARVLHRSTVSAHASRSRPRVARFQLLLTRRGPPGQLLAVDLLKLTRGTILRERLRNDTTRAQQPSNAVKQGRKGGGSQCATPYWLAAPLLVAGA